MFFRDLLVASVAAGLGLSMIQVALVNRGWWFENFLVRQIESSRGRTFARKTLGIGGTAMIMLGAWTLFAPWIKTSARKASIPLPHAAEIEIQEF